jgi:hypothetical protein
MHAGQTALEQLPGLGGAPAAQALLGQRGPVLDRVGHGEPLRHLAQVALRIDHRADVPHRLAGGTAVLQVGHDLEEEIGQAADQRQRHDDEQPLAAPAGPHDVGQAKQLQTEDQGGERGHGDDGCEIGERTAVSQILP